MAVLYWSLVALMGLGVLGAFLPGLPGSILIVVAILVWGFAHGFAGLTVPLVVAILVTLGNTGIDLLAAYFGAQKAGASRWGQIGAIVGLVVGLLGLLPALPVGGPLLGLLLGPLLGAIAGEYLYRRDLTLAVKAGIGIVVGSLIGLVIQGLLALVALIVFLIATWGSWDLAELPSSLLLAFLQQGL